MNATHYIAFFTTRKGHYERSVCGAWVKPKDHSVEPTCAACQVWLHDDTEDVRRIIAAERTREDGIFAAAKRILAVALLLLVGAGAAQAQDTRAPTRTLKTLRWTALAAQGLDAATILYPQRADYIAVTGAAAEWGIAWGAWEKKHQKLAMVTYIALTAAHSTGAAYKIHERWGTRQFAWQRP